MPRSGYVAELRRLVGHQLLLLPSATACIFDEAGRMLLVLHADGEHWATPGGALEPGETPAEAVVRECREETGLDVRPVEILGVFGGPAHEMVYDNGDLVQYVTTAFRCEVEGGELQPDGTEVTAARYVGAQQWPHLAVPRWAHDAFPVLYGGQAGPRQRGPEAVGDASGELILEDRSLKVVDGELDDAGSWVYAWVAEEGVHYVGATGLSPTVRTWLHLHDERPGIGRVRAQQPDALVGRTEVRAFRLAEELDRERVKQAVLARLEDAGGAGEPMSATESTAAEIVDRLRGPAVRSASWAHP